MIRIDHHVIGHFEIKIAQSMKLLFGQLLCVFFAQQIRTAGRRNKKRIAGENSPWLVRMIDISQQIRQVLGRVTRRMPRGHQHLTKFKTVAILHFLAIEPVLGAAFTNCYKFWPIRRGRITRGNR